MEQENTYLPVIKVLCLMALALLASGVVYGISKGGDAAVAVSGCAFALSAAFASFAAYLRPRGMEAAHGISMLIEHAEWQWGPSGRELELYWSGEIRRVFRTGLLWPAFGVAEALFLYMLGWVMTFSFSHTGILIFAAIGFAAGLAGELVRLTAVCLRRKRSLIFKFRVYMSTEGAYWGGTYVPFEAGRLKLSHAGCSGSRPLLVLTLSGRSRWRWFPNLPAVYALPAPSDDSMMQSLLTALSHCYGFDNPEGETYGKNEHSTMVGFQ